MIGITFMAMGQQVAPAGPTAAVKACEQWFAGRHDSAASGETLRPANAVRCFDGAIDDRSARAFVASLRSAPSGSRPTLVVRSTGGEVGAAMLMADEVARTDATVVARNVCLSSCANYVMGAARIRIVPADTLLGFHGGVIALTQEDMRRRAESEHIQLTEEEAAVASARTITDARVQTRFVERNGISPDFFAWMERFNHLPESARTAVCGEGTQPQFLVVAPRVLASKGYRLARYSGPRSANDLAAILKRYGMPEGVACFIDQAHAGF